MTHLKKKKTVVIGVSSGIAAYKVLDLVFSLKKRGLNVVVLMTENATKMVSLKKFEHVSGNKVYTKLFEKNFDYERILKERKVDHIEIADAANIVVIAPATANIIAKLAHGISDDFLTTSVLATQASIIVCPSMNVHMWQNAAVQTNISLLKNRGFIILEPDEGSLACGYEGKGRLIDLRKIEQEVKYLLNVQKSLEGKKVLVTAGATIEWIDDVRFITNPASGKMGIAIAEECFLRGADVLLLRSKNSVEPKYHIPQEIFQTAADLQVLIKKSITSCDMFFHTAAVSDFSVTNKKEGKISSSGSVTLALTPKEKIIAFVKKLNPSVQLIAFKAEYNVSEKELIKRSRAKLNEWKADFVVANDVGKKDRGFGTDTNEVYVVSPSGSHKKISLASKQDIAKGIVDYLLL